MGQERGRINRFIESEPGEGWIEGDYRFKSRNYDYVIYQRGEPGTDIDEETGERGKGERARKAYGLNHPEIVMGWQLDPSEHGGRKGVILRDYDVVESKYSPVRIETKEAA